MLQGVFMFSTGNEICEFLFIAKWNFDRNIFAVRAIFFVLCSLQRK